MDFESQLIWPDSEDLLHAIVSFNKATPFSLSLTPFQVLPSIGQGPVAFVFPTSFNERREMPILETNEEPAVLNLSLSVSSVVSSPGTIFRGHDC
jgi:hypothetical protein